MFLKEILKRGYLAKCGQGGRIASGRTGNDIWSPGQIWSQQEPASCRRNE